MPQKHHPLKGGGQNKTGRTTGECARCAADLRNLKRCLEKHYQELECTFTTDITKVKSAYRKRALKTHPDKGGDEELFRKARTSCDKIAINLAYFVQKYPRYREEIVVAQPSSEQAA